MLRRGPRLPSALLLGLVVSSCATVRVARTANGARLAVLTPIDGVSIRSPDILGVGREDEVEAARQRTLESLRGARCRAPAANAGAPPAVAVPGSAARTTRPLRAGAARNRP